MMKNLVQLSASIRGNSSRVPIVSLSRVCLIVFASMALLIGRAMAADKHTIDTVAKSSERAAPVISLPASSVRQRPVWEIGVAGGYYAGHDYPASNNENRRALALPFFVYRGPRWRLGGGGVRAVAVERPRVRLDLSLGGSLNASSKDNRAREGMPDLDFLFEVGPQLEVSLLQRRIPPGGLLQLRFTTELRAVLSTDFRRVDGRGVVAEAGVGLTLRNFQDRGIDLLAGIQSTFASERLQDYFYEVDSRFVTQQREAFDARSGYLETSAFLGIGFSPFRDVRLFTGVFTGWFGGARNRESPLYETDSSTGFAIGLVWTLRQSQRTVSVVELGESF